MRVERRTCVPAYMCMRRALANMMCVQRAERLRDSSAASSSRHRQSRESTSRTPFTTSCAKSGNTTKTCRDTLVVAVPGVSPRTSFKWIRSKTRAAVGNARSCRVVVSCPKHETLGCTLRIHCRQLPSSKGSRGWEKGRREQDETTCIGYRTTLFKRASASESTNGARENVQHHQTHWNSVKCCHNEARRHLPKRTLHLMFMPYNAWELRKDNHHQRPTIFEIRTKAELSGKKRG